MRILRGAPSGAYVRRAGDDRELAREVAEIAIPRGFLGRLRSLLSRK